MFRNNAGAISPPELGTQTLVVSSTSTQRIDSVVVVVARHDGDEMWTLRVRTNDVHGQAAYAVQHNNPLSELKVRR